MLQYYKAFLALKFDRRAVMALEYAILAGIVSVALIAAFANWGDVLTAKVTTALAASK